MKKNSQIGLILLFIFGTIPLTVFSQSEFNLDPKIQNNGPIIRLVTSNLPKEPLIILKGGSIDWENPGIRIEQMRIVANRLNIRFSYTRQPWQRALKNTEKGAADAVFVTAYSTERAVWGVYPMRNSKPDIRKAISKIFYWLYSRKDSSVTWDGKELTGVKSIGASYGDLMSEILKKEGYNVVEVVTYRQLIRMLHAGRLDASVGFRSLGDKVIAENPSKFNNIVKHPIPLKKLVGYLVFHKEFYSKNQETVEKIWATFQMLWEDGTMDKLFEKWGYR